MPVRPVTNHDLAALLEATGFDRSHTALARQVNHAAKAEYGLITAYDGASVYWWLRGRSPDQPAPELVARILGRSLGRQITLDELGFPRAAAAEQDTLRYPDTIEESITLATELWNRLGRQRTGQDPAPFAVRAAAEAGWRWHFDPPDPSAAHHGRIRVRAADVELLRAVQIHFLDLDKRHGGGGTRSLLADVLSRQVAPLLAGQYSDTVGRELFQVAAELTCASAFTLYDSADHGRAQRAFIQALRLSKAAGDRALGAHVLANLATQAVYLDKPAEALRLARAAVEGAGTSPPAMVAARLYSTVATAHAQAGDAGSFRRALASSQTALDRADGSGPTWAGYFTAAHLAGSAMRSLLDLQLPTEALGHEAAALNLPEGNVRTLALHTALSATAHARAGNIDQAADLGILAAEQATRVRSSRVAARVNTVIGLLTAHRALPQAARFLELAADFGHRPALARDLR
jgi:hypothetical protein